MNTLEKFQQELASLEGTPDFELYGLLFDVTEEIYRVLVSRGLTKAQLAERLGTSRAYVTKLLDGHENMTLKTLVRVANAMEMTVDVRLTPRKANAVAPAASVKSAIGARMRYAPSPITSGQKATVKTATGRGMQTGSTAKPAATARTASPGKK